MKSYCNPLNLRYQYQHYGSAAHREAADPTLVFFKGRYYLFASMSGGFYHSDDLVHWDFHENRGLDLYRYAPDVHEIDGALVFCASTRGENSTLWRTNDPLSDCFEKVSEPFAFWDPALFQDEDGRVYLYWGCDFGKPIYGIELNAKTLLPIGEKKELVFGAPQRHGWERRTYPGMPPQKSTWTMRVLYLLMALSGRGKDTPFVEGAYMNKWNGRYYLQYAAPATELATYADGVYTGEGPLGPFTYQEHNPVSFKPGGFITGAGHGSTIEDEYGNLWHAATMRVSVNANFERRVGLFPAGVDEDGIFYCNQNFADYPLEIPTGKFDSRKIVPKWMLLSYKKSTRASSNEPGHESELALDEDIRTSWCAVGSGGEWLQIDLGEQYDVRAVQLNFADVDVPVLQVPKAWRSNLATNHRYIDTDETMKTRYFLEGSLDDKSWFPLEDKRLADTDLAHDYLEFKDGVSLRYLRVTAVQLPYNKKFALSSVRVFGIGNCAPPQAVTDICTQRLDPLTARVSWKKVKGAIGYNVRFGLTPTKLYLSHMVYGACDVLLTALNAESCYYVCVDSFGEGGVTSSLKLKSV